MPNHPLNNTSIESLQACIQWNIDRANACRGAIEGKDYRAACKRNYKRYTRNIDMIHQYLIDSGRN